MDITINNSRKVLEKYLGSEIGRLEHSVRVAEVAKMLAEKNNVPVDEAVIAALLHDIGKSITKRKMLEMCALRGITMYEFEIFESLGALHGKAGAILFEREFDKENNPEKFERIRHAIISHVAGADDGMTILDKVVYIADNIEPEKTKRKNPRDCNQIETDTLLRKMQDGRISNLDDCIRIIIAEKKERARIRGVEYNPMIDNILGTEEGELER